MASFIHYANFITSPDDFGVLDGVRHVIMQSCDWAKVKDMLLPKVNPSDSAETTTQLCRINLGSLQAIALADGGPTSNFGLVVNKMEQEDIKYLITNSTRPNTSLLQSIETALAVK